MNSASAATKTDPLVEAIARFYFDPLGFVYFVFPWEEPGTLLADESGPDDWQAEVLSLLGKRLREGADADEAVREAVQIAVASGHGVGKTALVGWIIIWFISTRPHPNIVVTANTSVQLQTKTWRELAKWHKLARNAAWFEWTATKFYLKSSPETWFAAAIPWSVKRSEAFAGTHEQHVLVIFDEASAVADIIWEVVEGAMSTGECLWVAFGNPTRNTGRFRECWRKFRHRWITRRVDGRKAKMANKAQIETWIEDYGEDSDFVRIRVRGVFPRAGSNQFIAEDIVYEARQRNADGCDGAPVILGVDVARFGDDQSVILVRQGTAILDIKRFRGLDTMKLSARVAEAHREHHPSAVFVDGVGVGAGVVDRLRQMDYDVTDVNGGAKALDEKIYYNHRAEMWGAMRNWIKAGGCLPERDQELADDLVAPEYGFDGRNRLQLERKEDMKTRGLPSPDSGDALALTFATPVSPFFRRADITAALTNDVKPLFADQAG